MPPTREHKLEALDRGAAGEDLVAEQLLADDWIVLDRNWHGGGGELDLVVTREASVRFVEVKTRQTGDESGLDSITSHKRGRLVSAARAWILSHQSERYNECAFLVALVSMDPHGTPSVEWIDNPFDAR